MIIDFPEDSEIICQTLYGTESLCSRCIGYCNFHKAYVTHKQMKTKQCLQKNCKAFIKNVNHQFWIEREQKKEEIKLKRVREKRIEEERLSRLHLITESQEKKNPHIRQKRFISLDLKTCELVGKHKKEAKGMSGEVIQIGAVMLDEHLNYLSQFSNFVKPVYGIISEETVDNPNFYKDSLEQADTFSKAFYKLFVWAGSNKDDVITFCWSNLVYSQLWDEIFIKAKNHDEYRNFLKTFVDLQELLDDALCSEQQVSFESALRYCHVKFDGIRDSALTYAFNQARIFNKLFKYNKQNLIINPLWKYTQTDLSKYYYTRKSHSNDFTSSFVSFMTEDLIKQFTKTENPVELKTQKAKTNKFLLRISKFFSCSKYGINVNNWIKFSTRMLFIKDVNYSNYQTQKYSGDE